VSKVLRWLPEAVSDLARLREFIRVHNPDAAARAAERMLASVRNLQAHPLIGRPVVDIDRPKFRDLFIPFGQTGYCLRYTVTDTEIIIVRIWHTREDRSAF
jgi:plasmid stabilization system protein ParE